MRGGDGDGGGGGGGGGLCGDCSLGDIRVVNWVETKERDNGDVRSHVEVHLRDEKTKLGNDRSHTTCKENSSIRG